MNSSDSIFDVLLKKVLPSIKIDSPIYNSIKNYLKKRHQKFSTIDSLAFPNMQIDFDKLYEPLTLIIGKTKYKIDNSSNFHNLFLNHQRIIIEDTAGMGKSTVIKKIFKLFIENTIEIPYFVELRHINKENTIIQEIQRQINQNEDNGLETSILINILKRGGSLIIFDGYDEIPNNNRNFTTKNLHEFIDICAGNFFIIASRSEPSLQSYGNFLKARINPLRDDEAFALLYRYDAYSYRPIARLLIDKILNDNDISIREYLENPLLVSLLFKSFDYKKDIPLKKTLFYRQIFDALFEAHDLTKEGYFRREKYCQLHSDDFEKVLRFLAFLTAKENKIEYSRDYLHKILNIILMKVPKLSFKPKDFIDDLLETVPLFKEEGNDLKWSHKSLQDYFAAKFLYLDASNDQEPLLSKIFYHSRREQFNNLIDLFSELDPKVFECTFLYWFCLDFEFFAQKHINTLSDIPVDLKKIRIGSLFYKTIKILVIESKYYNDDNKVFSILKGEELMTQEMYKNFSIYFVPLSNPAKTLVLLLDQQMKNTGLFKIIMKKYPELLSFSSNNLSKPDLDNINIQHNKVYSYNFENDNFINQKNHFLLFNQLISFGFLYNYEEILKKLDEIKQLISGRGTEYLYDFS